MRFGLCFGGKVLFERNHYGKNFDTNLLGSVGEAVQSAILG
jgi:hypothetical protein